MFDFIFGIGNLFATLAYYHVLGTFFLVFIVGGGLMIWVGLQSLYEKLVGKDGDVGR